MSFPVPSSLVTIVLQLLSPTGRSVVILDKLFGLDPRSVYVSLKLIRRVSKAIGMSVLLTASSPEAQQGLFHLFDDVVAFSEQVSDFFRVYTRLFSLLFVT